MNASSVNWRNKIHDNITKKNILEFFFLTKFWIWKIFRQFWENLEEIWIGTGAEFRPKIGSKKNTEYHPLHKSIYLPHIS